MAGEIASVIKSREIKYLVHFTRESNLASILEHGLIPRGSLERKVANFTVNDTLRWDGRRSFNCLSISFPNGQMLFKYMSDNQTVNWPILILRPSVLVEKQALFCKHNAADNRMSSLPANELRTADAFRGMFAEIDGFQSRDEQGLKPCDPTDVQAEVLVRGTIEPKYIGSVVFPDKATAAKFEQPLAGKRALVHTRAGLYGNRTFFRKYGAGK